MDAPDTGERRQAVVMFSDLSGYTAMNESLDPEEVEATLVRIKDEAVAVIERWGGTVNQFVGDEVMALFGVPLARRDDARHAVSAALELHRIVDAMSTDLQARAGRALTLHTGIATGLVVTRRSDQRGGDFNVTGDAVNTAARLRSLAAPGELAVSEGIWQQVSAVFDGDAGTLAEVKGKEQPLRVYRVRGERIAAERQTPQIVGRDEELREFHAVVEACRQRGRGRVVVVRGDPGVGKSRLVAEFVRDARASGLACHSAAVLDFGVETGRDAVRSLARSLLGLGVAADEAARSAAVAQALAQPSLAATHELALYDLAGVTPPPAMRALLAAMSVATRDSGSLRALCALAANACAVAPLLLLVDDIHWADAWALERLAALAALARSHPLLLVMTTRFAGDPTSLAWRAALHGAPLLGVDLGPLLPEDALRMAASASAAPQAFVRSCLERAEGNPLFLEQLLLSAHDTPSVNLPGSIQALVHARLDRLAAPDKAALQAASVLGQRFTLAALRQLVEDPGCECRVLTEHFLVRPDGEEFMFCHALIRDGAYASLLHSSRRKLHLRAADWFGLREPALAAEHLDLGNDARAPLAYLTASRAEAAQWRFETALGLAQRGAEIASDRRARFEIEMARAQYLIELGRAAEAVDVCSAALPLSEGPGERATALIRQAAAMRLNDRIEDGLAALHEAEPLAEQAGLAFELSRLHHLRGNLLFPLGRPDECLRAHQQALAHAVTAGSMEAQAAALGGLGDAQYLLGHMASASEQFLKCVALSREHGFGRLEVANLQMVGWSLLHLNEMRRAIEIGHAAIELALRAAQPRAEMLARLLVAWVDGLVGGNTETAQVQLERALALTRALGAKRFEAQMLGCGALASLRRGDRGAARADAETALAISREHGMGHIGPWILAILARLEADPPARARLLAEAEAELRRGCVSHNHIFVRELGIDTALAARDWAGAEAQCASLEAYTVGQPLPFSDFLIGRGRALASWGRGQREPALRDELARLRDVALASELNVASLALVEALNAQAPSPPSVI
ncbi:MAG: adenylate/guanylate cyclase domain-containing protein [Burkholderiales bacterium]